MNTSSRLENPQRNARSEPLPIETGIPIASWVSQQQLREIWLTVRNLVDTRLSAPSSGSGQRRDRLHGAHHGRTIAIYVCHVVLQISMTDIARAVGRHRTTIGYTCAMVEDRRDDGAFDELVTQIEDALRLLVICQGSANHVL